MVSGEYNEFLSNPKGILRWIWEKIWEILDKFLKKIRKNFWVRFAKILWKTNQNFQINLVDLPGFTFLFRFWILFRGGVWTPAFESRISGKWGRKTIKNYISCIRHQKGWGRGPGEGLLPWGSDRIVYVSVITSEIWCLFFTERKILIVKRRICVFFTSRLLGRGRFYWS